MSTVSGVFPNAITPTFAASTDPAQEQRQRRLDERAVFVPVEQVEETDTTQPSRLQQPGRLEAEGQTQTSSQTASADTADSTQVQPADQTRQQALETARIEQERLRAEQAEISELAARDREVRQHEQAHQAVGGTYAGSAEYTYTRGPDGRLYATGGEVSVSIPSGNGDPRKLLEAAEQVERAALAPAEPSSQDRRVAALAAQLQVDARAEIRELEQAESEQRAEERSEQQAISDNADNDVQENAEDEEDALTALAEENDERLADILEQTSETVEAALQAAYNTEPLRAIGFNLDTTV